MSKINLSKKNDEKYLGYIKEAFKKVKELKLENEIVNKINSQSKKKIDILFEEI